MFSIYGTTGRVFNGALEDLRRLKAPGRTDRVDAFGDLLNSFVAAPDPQGGADPGGAGGAAREAVDAYASTRRGPRHTITRVGELMSRQVVVVSHSLSLAQAWQRLSESGHAQAPVVDAQGRLVGLVQRGLLAAEPALLDAAALAAHWAGPVTGCMRTPVPAVDPETDVRRAADALVATGLPGLPVVASAAGAGGLPNALADQPIGFISRTDLLRALAHDPPVDLWA